MMQPVDAGALEVTELESWLDAECPCEAKHVHTPCSEVVIARIVSCSRDFRCCQSWVVLITARMASELRCPSCKNYASDCWRIIPI